MSSNILKADNGVSSGTTGLVYTAGNDGTLQLATTTSGGSAVTALTIDNNQIATFANKLTAASMPTGSVVQVVNSYYQLSTSTTGTSFVSTSYSVTITPQFSTSKIFLLMTCYGAAVSASTNLYVQLWRGGSNIIPNAKNWIEIENPSSNTIALPVTQSFFEAPNSTSSLTYTIYIASSNSNAVYLMNNGPGYGYLNLTAQEIR